MVDDELCSNLGSKRDAVELISRDMHGCIPAKVVVALLQFQHAYVTAAEVVVDDADLV